MASTGRIDDLVSEAAFKQIELLTDKVGNSNKVLLNHINTINQFNSAIGGSKSNQELAANVDKQSKSIENLSNTNAKARLEEIKLQQAREKAFDDYERKLVKQQALADKAAAADAARAAKSLADSERLRAAAEKKASVIGPTITGGSGESRELTKQETDAIDRKNEALRQERIALAETSQQQQIKTQVQKEGAATSKTSTSAESELTAQEQKLQNIINQTTGTLKQNVQQNVQLELQLKNVQKQLKDGSASTDGNTASKAQLVQKEIELKNAIQQNLVVIKQQVRDQQNSGTSAEALNSRLTLLRTAYNSLTEEERKNKDVGGVLLQSITELDKKTKELASSTGVNTKSVGDYEAKIRSALTALVPYGGEIVKVADSLKKADAEAGKNSTSLGRLGAVFAAFSTAAFITAISAAKYYLNQFGDTQAKVDTYLSGLKQSFGVLGEVFTGNIKVSSIGEFRKLTLEAKNAGEGIANIKREFKNYNDILTVNNDRLRANADELRAQARDKLLSPETRIELLKKAQDIESQVIVNSKTNAEKQINVAVSVANAYKKLSKDQIEALQKGDIELANSLKRRGSKGGITTEGYELYKEALAAQTQVLRDETLRQTRIQNDRDLIQLRTDKKDFAAGQELNKEKLEEQKVAARAILESDLTSYEERLTANKIFINASISLLKINKREQLNNIDPLLSQAGKADKRAAIELKTKNDIDIIRVEGAKTAKKIQEDINKKYDELQKQRYKNLTDAEKSEILALQDASNQRLQIIDKETNEAKKLLLAQFANGEINTSEYNTRLFGIEQSASARRIELQIETVKKVIAAQAAGLAFGIGSNADLQKSTEDLTKLVNDSEQLKTKVVLDNAKIREDAIKNLQKLEADLAQQSLELIAKVVSARFDAQQKDLDDQSNAIDKKADKDKKDVDRSLLTSEQKADAEALIDAQATSQKEAIAQQQKDIAKEQADYEKAIGLLRIAVKTGETIFALEASAAQASAQGALLLANPLTAAFAPIAFAAAGAILAQIPFVIGQGLVQAAAVALVPGFFKGTDNAPGGLAWVGERGSELIVDPQGRTTLSPNGATLSYLQPGTQVFTHEKTMQMLSKPEKLSPAQSGGMSWDAFARLQERQTSRLEKSMGVRVTTQKITRGGFRTIQQQNNSRTEYKNRYLR